MVLKKALNYEDKSSYNLVIEARDGGEEKVLRSFADVIVQVEDVQDQDPVFLNGPYSATVPEETAPGSTIFEIQVRDGDTGIPRPIDLPIPPNFFQYIIFLALSIQRDP